MQTLRMLGEIGLAASDSGEMDALLRQPKSLALLAYLAMPRPGTWHRRDVLLATFWPELSQSKARTALRSALHVLRRHLAEGTIRTRGDDEVGVDPDVLTSDVAAMLDDAATQDHARALGRYEGELLPGLFIGDVPEFERWLDGERARLRAFAVKEAASLVDEYERAGDLARATDAARRACELDPDDEPATRRWITLLDRAGDRTQAHAVFEQFRSRAAVEFGTDPSPQTVALMRGMRAGSAVAAGAQPLRTNNVAEPEFVTPPATGAVAARGDSNAAAPRRRSNARWPIAAIVGAVALSSVVVFFPRSDARVAANASGLRGPAPDGSASRRLVLLPIVDETGDSSLRYLATGIAYGVTRRLERLGSLTIRAGAPSEWPASAHRGVKAAGPLGPSVLLRVTLTRDADSLDVGAAMVDSATGDERQILARRYTTADLGNLESHVAAAVAGALFRVGVPFSPSPRAASADPESFRLTILGYHQMITVRDRATALRSFVRATELDPSNARAWAGVSSIWGSRTVNSAVSLEEGFERTAAAASRALAIDSSQGSALANLGAVNIMKYRKLSAGMPLIRRAMAAEPSNPEVFLIASFVSSRYGHQWDEARDLIRIARQLDPLTAHFMESEASLELCAGRPAASIVLYRQLLAMDPGSADGHAGLVRALARAGRYDEALDWWRRNMPATTLPQVAATLAAATGKSGYLAVQRVEGGLLLAEATHSREYQAKGSLRALQLQFQSGDTAAGFASLATAMKDREPWIYRLRCMAQLDEARELPRFKALLTEIGAMPAR